MTVNDFLNQLNFIKVHETVYMLGTFGQPVTTSLILSKAKQLPAWYTKAKQNKLIGHVGNYAFDCIGLIKAVFWGWSANKSDTHGGAKYQSNGLADVNETGFLNQYCYDVSTKFAAIERGEVVWMSGHIGVYIGDGKVIECSPKWQNNVQVTYLANIGYTTGHSRTWTKHAKIKLLSGYSSAIKPDNSFNRDTIIRLQKLFGTTQDGYLSAQCLSDQPYNTIPAGLKEVYADKIGANMPGSELIEKIQKWVGARVDGKAGKETWTKLQQKMKKIGIYEGAVDGKCEAWTMDALNKLSRYEKLPK